jgi:hypothetical protein
MAPTLHAKLSASGAERWLNCPGSVAAEVGLPDKGSAFADEGSAAHELAEMVLTRKIRYASDWFGLSLPDHNAIVADEVMCSYVQEYIDFVESLPGELFPEIRVDFSHIVPDGFGTSDVVILDLPNRTLRIVDLKYGKGIKVDAENNPQLKLYALGALEHFAFMFDISEIDKVFVAIHQPRLQHISEYTYQTHELVEWGEWCSHMAREALKPDARRVPGEKQCQWCKAKATCPALREYTESVLRMGFDDLSVNDGEIVVPKLSKEWLRKIMDAAPLIRNWLDSVEDHIREQLETGETFPGYKMVEGRSNRDWVDYDRAEKELIARIGDKAHTRKLISPAQAEKVIGKKDIHLLDDLIVKSSGKPTLAKESDKRPAINAQVSDFDDLDVNCKH